jgi:hypothetical protein
MPVRSLSRTLKSGAAAGALTLALSGTALAIPAPPDSGMPGSTVSGSNSSGNVTTGTDVAAPDQQNPIPPETKPVPQQAPTFALHPHVLRHTGAAGASAPSASGDFQWDDAGIGAGGALVVVLAGLGGTLAIRRRQISDPPLAA